MALLKIVLTGAEYWDGASSVMPHAVSFAQSQKTGVPADPAYHKAMSIKCDKPEQKVGEETKWDSSGRRHERARCS